MGHPIVRPHDRLSFRRGGKYYKVLTGSLEARLCCFLPKPSAQMSPLVNQMKSLRPWKLRDGTVSSLGEGTDRQGLSLWGWGRRWEFKTSLADSLSCRTRSHRNIHSLPGCRATFRKEKQLNSVVQFKWQIFQNGSSRGVTDTPEQRALHK